MKTWALVCLALSACVSHQDLDLKLFQQEQLRLQRDMLEDDRLRLWLDHMGGRRR